ncbi:MAG: helix-turn-helix transcriptional regulator [Proteobacteria bacterium]|nr:helix-turn-helix transcriptional regulator [Pseudomonadota bacterium]
MILDRFLASLDVGVVAFAICEVRLGFSLVLQDDTETRLHYVLSGEGTARTTAGKEFPLTPHTLVIAPPKSCVIVNTTRKLEMQLPAPECQSLPGGWDKLTVGDGQDGVVLACGVLKATHSRGSGLFDHLRQPLVVSVAGDTSFREPFRRLLDELAVPLPGTRALAEILMKECLISLLRRYCTTREQQIPWFAAIEDPRLGKSVEAMLEQPEMPFTLHQLAEIAGMSRTTFSERFKEAFGCTPNDFLKDIRIRRGAHLLLSTDLPVKAIAYRVGYASRSYFSRAFKSVMDVDPATYRMTAHSMENGEFGALEKVYLA